MGPGNAHFIRLNVRPHFDVHAIRAVQFDRVRVVVNRPGQSANPMVDTTVAFPANTDTLELPLHLAITGNSEDLEVSMYYLDDPGAVVVFQAGPTPFTATLGTTSATVDVTPLYVGPGANATKVVITAVPPGVFFGDTASFTAQALDAGNNPIPGTPIVWTTLDATRASVPDESVGKVVGGSQRGSANIQASLLTTSLGVTPPSDTAALVVAPKPNQIAAQSGTGQSGTVGAPLGQAISFRVKAADNLGVQGAIVTFSAPAGSLLSATADTTDANGDVSVSWTLPTVPGSPSVTATVSGVAGLTASVGATANVGPATQLVFTVQPSTVLAGSAITPAMQVAARDQFGNPTPAFVANVSVAIGTNPGGATISGTTTVAAVAGVATFSNVRLSTSGTGYTLVASATGLTSATSAGLNVTAPANLISWINPAGGNWSVGANWSRGTAPVATDTVNISLAGTYTVNLDINTTVTRIEVGGASGTQTLQVNANNLVVTGTGAIGTSGRVALGGGSLAGAGIIDVAGQFNWTGGTLGGNAGTVRILAGGTLSMSMTSATFVNELLENNGAATWSGSGTINTGQSAVLQNMAGATFDFTGSGVLSLNQGGTAQFQNAGTFTKSIGTGAVTWTAGFIHLPGASGTIGTAGLTLSGGGLMGAPLQLNAPLTVGGGSWQLVNGFATTGTGAFTWSGGTLTTASATDTLKLINLTLSGGFLQHSGVVRVSQSFNWAAGDITGTGKVLIPVASSMTMTTVASRTFTNGIIENNATLTWSGTFTVNTGLGAVLRNMPGATTSLTGDGLFTLSQGGAATFDNQGTFNRTTSINTTNWTGAFDQAAAATSNINTGTFTLGGGGTQRGAFVVASGAFLDYSGGVYVFSTHQASGAGTVRWQAGILQTASATDSAKFGNLQLNGGTISETGVVFVGGLLDWAGNTTINGAGKVALPNAGSMTITGTAGRTFTTGTIENAGGTTWSGALQINTGLSAVFRNLPSGNFILSGDGSFTQNQGFPQALFDNQGTFARNTSTGTSTWGVFYQDTVGTLSVTTGTFALSGGARLGGSKTISAGAILDLTSGTVSVKTATAFAGTGLLRASGGSLLDVDSASAVAPVTNAVTAANFDLTGTASLAHEGLFIVGTTMNWTGGTIGSNVVGLGGTTRIAGTLNIGNAGGITLSGAHTLDNQGTVNYTGAGNMNVGLGPVITNGGNWVWSGNGSILNNQGAPTIQWNNVGNLQRTTSATAVTLDAVMNKTGGFNIAIGSLLLPRGSVTNFSGAVNGAGTLNLSGGTFTLTGNVAAAGGVIVSGATVVLNGFALGVAANFTTSGGGNLVMTSAADSLDINGNAAIGGGTGTLSNGVIRLAGSLTQTGVATYQPGPNTSPHRLVLDGTGAQTLSFASPVNSFFRRLEVNKTAGSVTLATDVRASWVRLMGGAAAYTISGATARFITDTIIGTNGSQTLSPLVVEVSSVLGDSGTFTPDTTVFTGTNQNIPNNVTIQFAYKSIRIAQASGVATWNLTTNRTLPNDLIVSSGTLNLNTHRINVTGVFRTEGTGVLRMQSAGDSLLVGGNATFAGGSTTGQLTAGATGFSSGFIQGGGATDAFAPSGTHHTVLATTGVAQSISFANPTTSFFDVLDLPAATHTVTMQTNVLVNDSLILQGGGGAADLVSLGTTQRLRVNGVISIPAVTASGRLAPAVLEMGNGIPAVGNIALPRGMSADTTVFLGTGGTLPVGPGIHYNHLRVSTTGAMAMAIDTITGDLVVNGTTAQFNFAGTFQTNRLRTQAGGVYAQALAGNTVVVVDSAIFGGGGSAPSAGTLTMLGNFVQQGGATNAFAATGTHVANLGNGNNTTASTVFFANPTTSFFNVLNINKSVSTRTTVNLLSDVRAAGNASVANATDLRGANMRFTVGGTLTATISTFSPTINTLLALELGAAPNVTISGATADTIVFNNAITNMPATGFTYDNVRINVTGTITLPAVTLAHDLDIATGTASIPGNFTINGKLRTRGSGILAMPVGGSPFVTVADSAIFAGGTSTPQTGFLRLLGHFNATGGSYEPNFTHQTVFAGNVAGGQRVFFSSPGVAGGNSWFGTLMLARAVSNLSAPVGITLTSPVFVTQQVQDSNTTTGVSDSVFSAGQVLTTTNFSAGGSTASAFVFNNTTLVLSGYTSFSTSGLTFRNMNPTSIYLTLNRNATGSDNPNGVSFLTVPTGAGRYFNMNSSATGAVTINFVSPVTPATGAGISGLYVRNGSPLPTVVWAGSTNP